YQFNPAVNEASSLVERYVAVWNETDAARRRDAITELWALDGVHVSDTGVRSGRVEIEAAASEISNVAAAAGFVFEAADRSHAHHDVVTFTWRCRSARNHKGNSVGTEHLHLRDDCE